MVSEDGDDQLDGLHRDLEFLVQGHGDNAVLKMTNKRSLLEANIRPYLPGASEIVIRFKRS